ncbi:hypothetical protein [Chitinophaga nivalis]|uniref:Carboxypeptidase regulatory-like domain-containing protein n=1 Tax=Chitinophaga nivalis TaxID=2991709 RepID=A0ABT3IL67_9BACT|nr:hypothetical protein [Chitinophaga nivalis]MCW3465600.1 hypothetical protein [Chitinophaga nivalis]MCW3484709.1 hypothetical protein [Chitinophaga nivalis]
MSYLLIGNISALICEDCIEPLANARIRVYLPDTSPQAATRKTTKVTPDHMRPLFAQEVLMKAERLLVEGKLDDKGNFSLVWENNNTDTAALELDLCLDEMPGKNGNIQSRNYHLSLLQPHWKNNGNGYVGAYAYLIPADVWRKICGNAGAWVITGTVRHSLKPGGQSHLKVEAYNAISGKLIGQTITNESGKYTLHFSRRDLYKGTLEPMRPGKMNRGPDVYFKVYRNEQLLWSETEHDAAVPERQDLPPCSCLNIKYKSSVVKRANLWLNDMITLRGIRKKHRDQYRFGYNARLIVKDFPFV